MLKFHNLFSFMVGGSFFVLLQNFSKPNPVFRYLIPVFGLYALGVFAYTRWYLKKIGIYNFWLAMRMFLLISAGFGIFFVLPNEFLRYVFLFSSIFLIAFFQYFAGNLSENIIINQALVVGFGFLFTLGAFSQYFINLPEISLAFMNYKNVNLNLTPVYTMGIFLTIGLTCRSLFENTPANLFAKNLTALVTALLCAELFWVLSFLPWHFSITTLILFNVYYLLVNLNYSLFFRTLTLNKIQFHFIVVVILTTLVLLTTPWKVVA